MQLLDTYNETLKAIYEYFGFNEGWAVFPLDDRRKYYWQLNDAEVTYYDSAEAHETEDEAHTYSDEILHEAIYEGAEFTMIMVDTHTDGNIFLAIYDNTKKVQ